MRPFLVAVVGLRTLTRLFMRPVNSARPRAGSREESRVSLWLRGRLAPALSSWPRVSNFFGALSVG